MDKFGRKCEEEKKVELCGVSFSLACPPLSPAPAGELSPVPPHCRSLSPHAGHLQCCQGETLCYLLFPAPSPASYSSLD